MTERAVTFAVRILIAAIALIAIAAAVLAFRPGSETRYPDELVVRQAGGGFLAIPALAIAAPGLVAWRRTRPWILWAWSAIAVIASTVAFAGMDDVHPRYADRVLWAARGVELGTWILASVAVLGALVAGFAARAVQLTPDDEAPVLAARLRRFIVAIAVLGLALVVVGLLPGQAVYDDANNCFGNALGSLGHTEHHHVDCTASYTDLRETRMAGGLPLAAYVVILLAPAIALYRAPSARRALWWIAWGVGGLLLAAALWFFVEFHLDLFSRTQTLWPARVVQAGIVALQALLLIVLPITIARSREPAVPAARVVER